MTTTADKVFAIPELLEAILYQLRHSCNFDATVDEEQCGGINDVFLAQRVCKRWCYAIRTSPRLQRALFFKAKSFSSLADDEQPETNPLLRDILEDIDCNMFPVYGNPDRIVWCEDLSSKDTSSGNGQMYNLPDCSHSWYVHLEYDQDYAKKSRVTSSLPDPGATCSLPIHHVLSTLST